MSHWARAPTESLPLLTGDKHLAPACRFRTPEAAGVLGLLQPAGALQICRRSVRWCAPDSTRRRHPAAAALCRLPLPLLASQPLGRLQSLKLGIDPQNAPAAYTCALTHAATPARSLTAPPSPLPPLLADLPGFTRSVYERNYALVTPESLVFGGNPLWANATTAHIISPASGANFAMALVNMGPLSAGAKQPEGHERFIFVLDGVVEVVAGGERVQLHADDFAYIPAHLKHTVTSATGAGLLIYERRYALKVGGAVMGGDGWNDRQGACMHAGQTPAQCTAQALGSPPTMQPLTRLLLLRVASPDAGPLQGSPRFVHGHTQEQALLPTPGEVFALRKLLPQTGDYDFNIHVMDFLPGQHLNVKEVHYNQHGLLLLQGKGIYRCGPAGVSLSLRCV